jgi:hypothetical protein
VIASGKGYLHFVQLLCNKRVNLNVRNKSNETAYDLAVMGLQVEVCEYLARLNPALVRIHILKSVYELGKGASSPSFMLPRSRRLSTDGQPTVFKQSLEDSQSFSSLNQIPLQEGWGWSSEWHCVNNWHSIMVPKSPTERSARRFSISHQNQETEKLVRRWARVMRKREPMEEVSESESAGSPSTEQNYLNKAIALIEKGMSVAPPPSTLSTPTFEVYQEAIQILLAGIQSTRFTHQSYSLDFPC